MNHLFIKMIFSMSALVLAVALLAGCGNASDPKPPSPLELISEAQQASDNAPPGNHFKFSLSYSTEPVSDQKFDLVVNGQSLSALNKEATVLMDDSELLTVMTRSMGEAECKTNDPYQCTPECPKTLFQRSPGAYCDDQSTALEIYTKVNPEFTGFDDPPESDLSNYTSADLNGEWEANETVLNASPDQASLWNNNLVDEIYKNTLPVEIQNQLPADVNLGDPEEVFENLPDNVQTGIRIALLQVINSSKVEDADSNWKLTVNLSELLEQIKENPELKSVFNFYLGEDTTVNAVQEHGQLTVDFNKVNSLPVKYQFTLSAPARQLGGQGSETVDFDVSLELSQFGQFSPELIVPPTETEPSSPSDLEKALNILAPDFGR